MYKKYYSIGWTVDLNGRCYSARKRFEADEEAKMAQFIFDLAHKEVFPKFGKTLLKKLCFNA